MKRYFISGIGTGVGKTMTSSVLCNTFDWDYWKPVQCGDLDNSDSDFIRTYAPKTVVHSEGKRLVTPASPHLAAEIEQVNLTLESLHCPEHTKPLLIEGAGGLLVPINDQEKMVDFVHHFDAELILVVDFYLGSLNHTLLSFEYLKQQKVPVYGVVYNRPDSNFEWLRKQHNFHEIGVIEQKQHQFTLKQFSK